MMMGSSPHTRGALSCRAHRWRIGWIIPAYAGSTVEIPAASFPSEDHPRIRGEHGSNSATTIWSTGSSPHTRGAREWEWQGSPSRWIIPAYAGSTPASPTPAPSRQDHPRIRGEHISSTRRQAHPLGSSPHTRGALGARRPRPWAPRIIPAYAGSTSSRERRRSKWQDHPRIRGEHGVRRHERVVDSGSSPHTRGAPARRHALAGPRRIIPAYAGSTFRRAMKPSQAADHPRIRGEHRILPPDQTLPGGSSPHTRGAPPSVKLYISLSLDHPRIRGEH